MSTNAERFQQLAEKVYPRHVPKPAGPRIVNGWRELPGGGWVKCGPVKSGGFILDDSGSKAGEQSPGSPGQKIWPGWR
jgi:hypothetical protein